jgi:hypothetical protein
MRRESSQSLEERAEWIRAEARKHGDRFLLPSSVLWDRDDPDYIACSLLVHRGEAEWLPNRIPGEGGLGPGIRFVTRL